MRQMPKRLTNEAFFTSRTLRLFRQQLEEPYPLHWHEFYELTYIVSGQGINIVNGRAYPLAAGHYFLLTPVDFHEIVPEPGGKLEIYNLIFSHEWMPEVLHEMLFMGRSEWMVALDETERDSVLLDYKRIEAEASSPSTLQETLLQSSLTLLLIALVRKLGTDQDTVAKPTVHVGIRRALIYIQQHFRDRLPLQDAARQAQLSPNYFSHRFREATGTAFQHYLQSLRLNFARSILQASGLTVSEICFGSGFQTLSHFEKAFKAKYGCSPREYRQLHRPSV